MLTKVFKIENLSCRFAETLVLSNVSFEIEHSQCVALIGPNGSGKSTLLNCISGFVESRGNIFWNSIKINNLSPHQRAKLGIGRIFQNPGIFKRLSVNENLQVAFEAQSGSSQKPNYKELLERVGLDKFSAQPAGMLSGGQLRLLEIARLICMQSDLLLLDEPTAGVSPKLKIEVRNLLLELKRSGKTILLVEHDMNFVAQLCQRALVLAEGQTFFDGSVEAAKSSRAVQELYFGSSES